MLPASCPCRIANLAHAYRGFRNQRRNDHPKSDALSRKTYRKFFVSHHSFRRPNGGAGLLFRLSPRLQVQASSIHRIQETAGSTSSRSVAGGFFASRHVARVSSTVFFTRTADSRRNSCRIRSTYYVWIDEVSSHANHALAMNSVLPVRSNMRANFKRRFGLPSGPSLFFHKLKSTRRASCPAIHFRSPPRRHTTRSIGLRHAALHRV